MRAFGTLTELLRAHRRRAMLTQEELAHRAGISVRTVSDIERGLQVAPRVSTLVRLAEALHLTAIETERLVATIAVPGDPGAFAAGTAATDAQAWQLAVAAYDDALRPILAETRADKRTCDALLDLGDAATMGLLRHHARPAYLQAARVAMTLQDRHRLLHAAAGYSFLTKAGEAGIGAERLWHQALLATTGDDLEARALLGAARATALLLDGAVSDARGAADRALEVAEGSGVGGAVVVAAAARCVTGWGDPDPERRLELAGLVAADTPARVPCSGLEGRELSAVPSLQLGHFAAFRTLVDEFEEAGSTATTHSVAAQAAQWRAAVLLLDGCAAEAMAAAALAVDTAGSPPNFTMGFHAQVFCAMRLDGRVAELIDQLRTQVSTPPVEPAWIAALIVALAETNADAPEATELVDRVLNELWPLSEGWTKLVVLAFLAEAAARLEGVVLANAVEDHLCAYQGQFVVVATGTSSEGSVDRYLACTAWARGDRQLASARFDAAIQAERAAGAPVLARSTEALRNALAR